MTLNLENPPVGEKEATQKLTELLRKKMVSENPNRMMRDAHPKQHGLVKAEFIVEPDLPAELQVGVFKEPRTYPAWIRFSNQNSPPLPDKDKDIRGMAIKLMGFDSPEQIEFGDNLSFTPWHSLPEHRPLGGINRARKIIYEALSEFRHQQNKVPQKEPTGFEPF